MFLLDARMFGKCSRVDSPQRCLNVRANIRQKHSANVVYANVWIITPCRHSSVFSLNVRANVHKKHSANVDRNICIRCLLNVTNIIWLLSLQYFRFTVCHLEFGATGNIHRPMCWGMLTLMFRSRGYWNLSEERNEWSKMSEMSRSFRSFPIAHSRSDERAGQLSLSSKYERF